MRSPEPLHNCFERAGLQQVRSEYLDGIDAVERSVMPLRRPPREPVASVPGRGERLSVGAGGTPLRSPEQDRPVARWEDP